MGILLINRSHIDFPSEELRSTRKPHLDIFMGTFLQGEGRQTLASSHKTVANSLCVTVKEENIGNPCSHCGKE